MFCGCMAFDGDNVKQIDSAILKTTPDMSDKIWKGVSQQAKAFILLMLEKD